MIMDRDTIVGPPFANLLDELRDRKLTVFEVDWINLLPHAIANLIHLCGQTLETVRLNSCGFLTDE